MAKGDAKITSPVPGFTGEVVGVRFTDGVATIPAGQKIAALEYFARHRYAIDREVEVGGPDGITVPASEAEKPDPKSKTPKGHDAAGPDPIPGSNAPAEADPAQGQV